MKRKALITEAPLLGLLVIWFFALSVSAQNTVLYLVSIGIWSFLIVLSVFVSLNFLVNNK